MGTNYYLAAPHLADHYDESERGVHIGKSSAGWTFGWRAQPELGITDRDGWERLFAECGDAYIVDEYGEVRTFAEFRQGAFIEHRDPDRRLRRLNSEDPGTNPRYLHLAPQTLDARGEVICHYAFS